MNKKGFTLVELLAVVAILGILSVVAIGAYSGVTNRSKQKAYESKVSQIETSAAKWARENNIDRTTSVSVNKLVVEGYLTADEATENGLSTIKNPVNNENMICKMVEITYKNGEIQTKFDATKNNCSLAEQALNDTQIKVVAYQKGVAGASAAISPNSNNALAWTNKALTLVVSSDTYKDETQNSKESNPVVAVSFDFNGSTTEKTIVIDNANPSNKKSNVYTGTTYLDDTTTYYNTFNVDAAVILDSNIVVSYRFKDGSTKSRTINVRIDKEEATASVIATSDWVTATQKVIVKLDDGNGSGARRFYVGVGNAYNDPGVQKVDLCDANGKKCKYEKEYNAPSVGEYNIWTEDMVGNISVQPKNKISVNNVDTSTPSCNFDNIGTMGQNNWYVTDVTPRMRTSVAGNSGLYFGISKTQNGKDNPNYSNYVGYGSVGISQAAKLSDTKGQDYTCYVKSLAGTKAQKKTNIKVDTTPPTITVSPTNQSSSYVKEKTITIKARDTISGLGKNSRIEYAWSTDSNNEPSTWQTVALPGTDYTGENGPTDEKTVTITAKGMTGVYYLWIKEGTISDAAGNTSQGLQGKSARYGPYKFDNTPPSCELQADGTVGDNSWYTSNVTISFKTHSDNDSGVKNYGISSTTGSKTASLTSDTSSKTYTGYIEDNAGNKSSCSITVKRDATKPSCSLQAVGTKGENDWYTSDITVKFKTSTDAMSGLAKKGIDNIANAETLHVTNDNTGTKYTGYVKDNAGNIGTCAASYKIDQTPPSCSLKTSGTNGDNGWFKSNVTVEVATHTDATSGVDGYGLSTSGANYTTTKLVQKDDTSGVKYTGYIKDKAGNKATCGPVTVKKDTKAPSCKLQASGTLGNNGWYKSNIVISFKSPTDATSGIAAKGIGGFDKADTLTVDYSTSGTTYYGFIKDNAGNQAICNAVYKVDKTVPTCSITASGSYGWNSWYNSDVEISLKSSGTDWPSGIKSYGIGSTTGATSAKLTTDTKSKTYTGYIEDEAGNIGSCAVTVKRDTTPPSCTLSKTCTNSGENGWCKSNVGIKFSSTYDAMSGVDGYGIGGYYNYPREKTLDYDSGANGVTYTGLIVDKAGNTSSCYTTAYRDTIPPASSICSSGFRVSGTSGNSGWYRSSVTLTSTSSDVNYFKVNGASTKYYSTYTMSSDGSHSAAITIYDDAGNSTTCPTKYFSIDKTYPTLWVSNADNGCPAGVNKTYRTGNVYDATSGLSKADSSYLIGADLEHAAYKSPVTPNGAHSGKEGFCSGIGSLYASWTLCDIAGNCTYDSGSW